MSMIKDMHFQVKKVTDRTLNEQKVLDDFVSTTVDNLRRKVDYITRLFNDTVLYSNKTYFLEEIYRQKSDNKQLRNLCNFLRQKLDFVKSNNKVKGINNRNVN